MLLAFYDICNSNLIMKNIHSFFKNKIDNAILSIIINIGDASILLNEKLFIFK